MKKIDKAILILFSIIMFTQSIIVMLVIPGWLKIETVQSLITLIMSYENSAKILLVVEAIILLSTIKTLFFMEQDVQSKNKGVLMQNDNGKLLISKPTIENIVKSAVKGFNSITDVNVNIDFDDYNGLIINVNLIVNNNVVIKELTVNLQNKIKDEIKKTSDLDVKEVNVKIKDIATKEDSIIKE